MSLEIYALFDKNDTPKKLKSSGCDEFYYYFPPPLPDFIVLFMVTKDPEEANYLFKISVCIDNELEDKYIGEMGGEKLSICWINDWTADEVTHAATVSALGRVLKLTVLKEDLPPAEEEYEYVEEETEEAGEEEDEGKTLQDEDELLKSSIAMLEDELDENEAALQRIQGTNGKSIIQEYMIGKVNGSHQNNTDNKSPKKRGRPRKIDRPASEIKPEETKADEVDEDDCNAHPCKIDDIVLKATKDTVEWLQCRLCPKWFHQYCVGVENHNAHLFECSACNGDTNQKKSTQHKPKVKKETEKKPKKTEKNTEKTTKAIKKSKTLSSETTEDSFDSFEFEDETEKMTINKVIAGRIGGKRASPFGSIPKIGKKEKTHQEKEENKSQIFSRPVSYSDILPTRNPSRRWGHSFCPLTPGKAIVIGGEGEKKLTNADAIWVLDSATSTWKSQLTDNPTVGRRVGHSACYDDNAKVVYLYGGLKHDQWFNEVYKLDTKTWKWTKLEAIGKAPTRAYHSCTMDFDELLIFGGVYPTTDTNSGCSSSELSIFSTEGKSWYTPIVSGDIPSGRSGHSACMLDRKLYIFGGWDTTQCFNDIHVLDLGIMNFTRQTTTGTVPSARTWHASQLLSDNKRFCIYGGFNGACALDDLFIFSSVDNSWTKLFYPGLVCRAGHDVIHRHNNENENGEKLLVFGGGDNDGHFYNDIATLNLGG